MILIGCNFICHLLMAYGYSLGSDECRYTILKTDQNRDLCFLSGSRILETLPVSDKLPVERSNDMKIRLCPF